MKNKYSINYIDIKTIFKTFLITAIPVIIVFMMLYNFILKMEIDKTKEIILEVQKQKAKIIAYIIEDYFTEIKEELLVIKNSNKLNRYLNNPTKANLIEVEKLFVRISSVKKTFDQIRLINNQGQEIIHMINDVGGVSLTTTEELQNIKDKEYYKKTSQFKEGEFFVSDMNLNIKNDKIQIPHKPTIRMATPLYGKNNLYQGIIIIDFLGEEIIHTFNKQFNDAEYSFIKLSLVNKNGYYLYNKKYDHNFGFMFEDKKNYTVYKEHPKLWNEINKSNIGHYEDKNNVYFFKKINPLMNIKVKDDMTYMWTLISDFNSNDLPHSKENTIFGMKTIDIVILIGINLLIFIVITINYRLSKNKKQLNITTKIANETNDAVIITDNHTQIVFVNKAFEKITGYSQDEVLGLKTNSFKSGKHPDAFFKEMWESINDTGYWHGELWDKKKDGLFYPKELSIIAVKDKSGKNIDKYIGVFTDLTNIREEQQNATILKNYNPETKLPNEILLKKLIEKSIENNPNKFGIICFSITNYSSFLLRNNKNNLLYMNSFITSINEMLETNDFIAQISKSTFIIGVLLDDNNNNIDNIINLFFSKSKKVHYVNDDEFYFDIKAGISLFPNDGITPNELINHAHIALEAVINEKEKSYMYYTPLLKENLENELKMNLQLRNAIFNNELNVYYQPQIEIENGKIVGAEALLRWNNGVLGCISPAVFVPLAETTGQIITIGYWVIERVFQDYLLIKDDINSAFRISINISSLQFKDNNLIPKFKELAQKYRVDLTHFEIEITENTFINDINLVNAKLKDFRKLGITVAIDDFGTGFSSLSYLKNLKIDKLKIDRSFIKDYPNHDNGEIAKVVTDIARELKLKVITEGAETKEQVTFLCSIGCHLIQGYYYSPPLEKSEFYKFFKTYL